ncbi:MAG: hypothetical protein AAGA34_00930 [Pseudomonadota bacterium]
MQPVKLAALGALALSVQGCGLLDPCTNWKSEVAQLEQDYAVVGADYPMTLATFQNCMADTKTGQAAGQVAGQALVCFSAVALMANDCTFGCAKRGGGVTSFDDFSYRMTQILTRQNQLAKTRPERCSL